MATALKIDLYSCAPGEAQLFGFHGNGTQHAAFATANAALAWWRGLGGTRQWFYVTNENGERVTLLDNEAHPGHAHAVLESIARREATS